MCPEMGMVANWNTMAININITTMKDYERPDFFSNASTLGSRPLNLTYKFIGWSVLPRERMLFLNELA